jgi:hypothetical protein
MDQRSGSSVLVDFPTSTDGLKPIQFCMNVRGNNYMLTTDRRLFTIGSSLFDGFFKILGWAAEQEWQQIDCGVLHDSFYGVGADGVLYRENVSLGLSLSDPAHRYDLATKGERAVLQSPDGARIYREGTQMRGLLSRAGDLLLYSYSDQDHVIQMLPHGRKLVDFAFFRLLGAQGLIGRKASQGEMGIFTRRCGVRYPQRDPWLGRLVGVDLQDHLVFEGRNGECLPAAIPVEWQGKVRSFEFVPMGKQWA